LAGDPNLKKIEDLISLTLRENAWFSDDDSELLKSENN
jgi:hypothetical protein